MKKTSPSKPLGFDGEVFAKRGVEDVALYKICAFNLAFSI